MTTQRRHYTGKDGVERVYESHLLRRSWREDGKVRNETVANLSQLPAATIELVRGSLAGKTFVPAETAARVVRSRPHGHVAAVWAQAKALGLPGLLGPAGRSRDLALALIVSRVVRPGSKLATLGWWSDTTLGEDLDVAGAGSDEVYSAMDWLVDRQDKIEAALARRHLTSREGPPVAMFDLSSSWVEGTHCPLAARGYSRDGKKNRLQVEYGLLTDSEGRPVAVRVFDGNTADPTAFIDAVDTVRSKFKLEQVTMVGDRGMITNARITALRELGGVGWLTALRAPQIAKLAAAGGPLQLTLFDTQDLAEITHPDYPGERLIACRNPALAAERARKRDELLTATETLLGKVTTRVAKGTLAGADTIGVAVGKVVNTYKMAKHLDITITDTSLTVTRRQEQIAAEAALDGIYVLRTCVPATRLDSAGVVTAYKNLAHVERDFRILKSDDLDLRPIHHHLEDRVRGHVLICMLAAYLTWHLRKAWAPLTFTDTQPPERDNPVAPAHRSPSADRKASRHADENDQPVRSYQDLLTHLATLTRNDLRYGQHDTDPVVPTLAEPTPTQRRAFELLDTTIPLTLK
ncbi:MAG: IS1634 family transposase [Jiangellales bacterium]